MAKAQGVPRRGHVGDGGHTPPSSGARTGLTAVMKGLCWSVVAGSAIIDQLPGRIGSGWQLQMMRVEIGRDGITLGEARRRQAGSIAAQRLGRREEFHAA
jgi:3-oxoacyl-[acyl-carrier protein] reductase